MQFLLSLQLLYVLDISGCSTGHHGRNVMKPWCDESFFSKLSRDVTLVREALRDLGDVRAFLSAATARFVDITERSIRGRRLELQRLAGGPGHGTHGLSFITA